MTTDITQSRKKYEPFELYLYDVSYYSGKMEMYLRYKQVPFQRRPVSMSDTYNVLYKNTGVMKVPVIAAKNGEWLRDTTPMIDWFEKMYPESSVMPNDGALFFISKLVEDYADEWLWRPAMYYRWWYDHNILGQRLARDAMANFPLPLWLKAKIVSNRQIKLFMKKDGITEQTRAHVEETYLKNLDSLQEILSETPYLLGDRPTLVDFGYMGPMFRHFFCDPTPVEIMRERAPAVFSWVARMWDTRASDCDQSKELNDFSNPGWEYILNDICRRAGCTDAGRYC
jgi:glutathione S-transferase